MTSIDVRRAIANENVVAFSKVKGIGPKTAKRVILDLRDKMIKEEIPQELSDGRELKDVQHEAVQALMALGFQRSQIQKALNSIYRPEMSVEEVIKTVLKQVSR